MAHAGPDDPHRGEPDGDGDRPRDRPARVRPPHRQRPTAPPGSRPSSTCTRSTASSITVLTRRTLDASTANTASIDTGGCAVDAGVVVGHEGDARVRDAELGGEHGLGVAGHVDHVPSHRPEPAALGTGREPRPVDHDHRAAVDHVGAGAPRRVDEDPPSSLSYGSAKLWWCTGGSSWNVSGRPQVRSTS